MDTFTVRRLFIEILNDRPSDYRSELFFKLHLMQIIPYVSSINSMSEINQYCNGMQNIIDNVQLPKNPTSAMSVNETENFKKIRLIALDELENMLKGGGLESWIEAIKSYYLKLA